MPRSTLLVALLLFAVLGAATPAMATRGLPLLQRYTSAEIPAAPGHSAIVSDERGVIYVGNGEGVLRFTGGEWELIPLPGRRGARSLLRAWDGRIYVGSYDLFGVLETRPDGSLRFEDLRPRFKLEGAAANVEAVWGLLETPRGLYFRADRTLFFLGRDGSTRQWPLVAEARLFYAVQEALYARVQGVGFSRFEDGRLVPMPGAEVFAQRPLLSVTTRGDGLLLASDDGFYLSDAHGIRKLPSAADAAFARNEPYSSHLLDDGSLVFGTYDGNLLRFSPGLSLLDRVKLGVHMLSAFGTDREGGLWVASEVDLVRLRLPSPWTQYTEQHGLLGTLNDSAWYDGALWAATSADVMRTATGSNDEAHFEPQHWTRLEAYDLEATPAGLLLAEREGLQVLDPGARAPRHLVEGQSIVEVKRSEHDASHALARGLDEVYWLVLRDGRWQVQATWPMDGMSVDVMYETAAGELWLADLRGTAQRWRFDPASGERGERSVFGPEQGIDADPDFGTTLLQLDGELYAMSGTRVFRWQGERFVPSELGSFAGVERPMELFVIETPLGDYAWTTRQLWHRRATGGQWLSMHLDARAARGFRQVDVQADGKLRVVTWSGLLQFDPEVPEPPTPDLQATLERIELRVPDQTPARLPLQSSGVPLFPPGSGLGFRFGLVSMEPNAEFRYRLVNYSDAWTPWNEERQLNYRSLPAGEFQLEVQARLRNGREAAALAYPFRVQPYWYQTPWATGLALLGGALMLGGLAQAFVRVRYRQFVTANRRLELKISERTRELEAANRRLSDLVTEDSLTGVANRRALEQALGREWQRCGELRLPLAVVMVDVDHFKQFNDHHGHLEGDRQLQRVARELGQEVKPVRELLARFGGEEFALILPGLHLDEAMARAERIRARVHHAELGNTISLGVAALVPSSALDPAELLRRADTALYRAKRRGRNRVEAADE